MDDKANYLRAYFRFFFCRCLQLCLAPQSIGASLPASEVRGRGCRSPRLPLEVLVRGWRLDVVGMRRWGVQGGKSRMCWPQDLPKRTRKTLSRFHRARYAEEDDKE